MTKIFENIFRAVNIGLVNETKQISKKLKIDMDEVVSLAKTKPFGFMPFYPGPGVGGHCIRRSILFILDCKTKIFQLNLFTLQVKLIQICQN